VKREFTFAQCTLLGALMFLVSCQGEEEEVEPMQAYLNVADELKPYFIRFEGEGLSRGFQVDLTSPGIAGEIEEISEENVVGQCYQSTHNPNRVLIDSKFWEAATDQYKEFIVFHELGHCFLGREHLDDAYPNGQCVSLMRSGLGDCWDLYNNRTREGYVDELFNPELYP